MDWLWPSLCVGCGAVGEGRLCRACRAVVPARPRLYVRGLAGAWTLARYDDPLGQALRHAKVKADRDVAVLLGELLARRLAPVMRDAPFTAVVPAPSTVASRVRRGFAPAAVFAEALGRAHDLPVVHALTRKAGARQATLDRTARRRNLVGKVRAEVSPGGLVLLVDDVLTTGATADACVRELLGSGAQRVWLVTVCVVARRRTRR